MFVESIEYRGSNSSENANISPPFFTWTTYVHLIVYLWYNIYVYIYIGYLYIYVMIMYIIMILYIILVYLCLLYYIVI